MVVAHYAAGNNGGANDGSGVDGGSWRHSLSGIQQDYTGQQPGQRYSHQARGGQLQPAEHGSRLGHQHGQQEGPHHQHFGQRKGLLPQYGGEEQHRQHHGRGAGRTGGGLRDHTTRGRGLVAPHPPRPQAQGQQRQRQQGKLQTQQVSAQHGVHVARYRLAGRVAPKFQSETPQQQQARLQQQPRAHRPAPVAGGQQHAAHRRAQQQGQQLRGHHRQAMGGRGRQPTRLHLRAPRQRAGRVREAPGGGRGLAEAAAREHAAHALHRQGRAQRQGQRVEHGPAQAQPAPQGGRREHRRQPAAQNRAGRIRGRVAKEQAAPLAHGVRDELGAQNQGQAAGRHQRQPGPHGEAAPPALPQQQQHVGERGQQVERRVVVVAGGVGEMHGRVRSGARWMSAPKFTFSNKQNANQFLGSSGF